MIKDYLYFFLEINVLLDVSDCIVTVIRSFLFIKIGWLRHIL